MFSKAINDLVGGASLYHVWIYQAWHDISAKYKRTALGSIWISGALVATSIALAIVIGGIQGQSIPDVLPYVMAGIMCFNLTLYILGEATDVYINSSNIIKNHAYPFTYYAFESVTRVFFVFLHNLVVFYIALAILQRLTIPHWSGILGLIVVYFNSLIWGSLSSMAAARFRDLRFLLPFLGQIAFFMTPVFWNPAGISGWRTHIINYNPFYGLLEIVRAPLLGYAAPEQAWVMALLSLGVGSVLWIIFFNAFRGKIAFWI